MHYYEHYNILLVAVINDNIFPRNVSDSAIAEKFRPPPDIFVALTKSSNVTEI